LTSSGLHTVVNVKDTIQYVASHWATAQLPGAKIEEVPGSFQLTVQIEDSEAWKSLRSFLSDFVWEYDGTTGMNRNDKKWPYILMDLCLQSKWVFIQQPSTAKEECFN
jgi:hypothetical protein